MNAVFNRRARFDLNLLGIERLHGIAEERIRIVIRRSAIKKGGFFCKGKGFAVWQVPNQATIVKANFFWKRNLFREAWISFLKKDLLFGDFLAGFFILANEDDGKVAFHFFS